MKDFIKILLIGIWCMFGPAIGFFTLEFIGYGLKKLFYGNTWEPSMLIEFPLTVLFFIFLIYWMYTWTGDFIFFKLKDHDD